jgi:O-antigen ligase
MSHSTGSMIATLCAIAFLPLLFILRFPMVQRIPLLLLALVVVTLGAILIFQNAALLPAIVSKDATLTGRTELWSLVLVAIDNRPWLGYGFDSFWQGMHGESLTIIRGVGWLVPTAHNGYLDLLLGVGIVGTALFAIPLLQMGIRALRHVSLEGSQARYYPIAFIILWLVYNLNESALLTRSGMPLLFLVALSTSLSLQRTDGSLSQYSPARIEYLYPHQANLT